MQAPLLSLVNFSCERDNRCLFEGLNARFNEGEIWHIEGPNGVGKTSLLRQITGISRSFGGELRWRGEPVSRARFELASDLLYIGHLPGIKASLSARENLAAYCPGVPDTVLDQALAGVGLFGFEDAPCYRLSAGQMRKVALARLSLSKQTLWVLDEPFTALDVKAVAALEQRFVGHAAAGGCVIMTTHQACQIDGLKTLRLGDYQPGRSA
ncbi:cytochrome c biogenesis heme-transporting ATPase CcmA [Simiduia agarivorans]|uniref:Cytochrome c biogenesis protein CcmA n=1 Tax=Simiduia agarivorans (strain DSM 21679 / JCM 13881 / BCRC 17597 / SA1) TaxID=1117647 RepID=K4KGG9_SIMAS|nr:cytochrome c biogenesis heme-transporting ATPase CcmA [Simiduia agarivorans]AFU97285.1 cytochrome c biogenesis protein CcmA [Simiduia agarivorans SA1 = DSM 21679]